ncbi:MAG: sigma-70 family RNA polymerase sigma factor [Patescibacteria group bacterium]
MNSHNEENLKSLILLSIEGRESSFQQLYEHLSDQLFRFVFARCSNREDTLDLLQDIFVDLWKALPKFKYSTDAEFYSFVFTITRRKLSKYYRFKNKSVVFDEKYIRENYEIQPEDYWLLEKIIPRLKDKYRQVLELRYFSDFTFAQIAKFLNIKESTAKVQHHRAIKQLSDIIKKYE